MAKDRGLSGPLKQHLKQQQQNLKRKDPDQPSESLRLRKPDQPTKQVRFQSEHSTQATSSTDPLPNAPQQPTSTDQPPSEQPTSTDQPHEPLLPTAEAADNEQDDQDTVDWRSTGSNSTEYYDDDDNYAALMTLEHAWARDSYDQVKSDSSSTYWKSVLRCPSQPTTFYANIIPPECVDQTHVSTDTPNIEVEFDSSLHQYLIGVPGIPHAGEHVIATFSSSSSSRSSSWSYAIVKEFDELTKDELRTYSKEVD